MKNTYSIFRTSMAVALLSGLGFGLSSCKDDDHDHHPHDDQEVITTLKLRVVNQADSTDTKEIVFRDPDGDGGQNGTISPDSLRLRTSAVYRAQLTVLNESNPADVKDLTNEILSEANQHQFFYTMLNGLSLVVNNYDLDANNLPLGLKADFNTGANASAGAVKISLSHFDQTPKNGTTPSGETDIEVVFPVRIQP